jgi:RimJ/RimL family protein N-acetyltransferase
MTRVSGTFSIPILQGNVVRLEPLSLVHVEGLVEAASEDRANYTYTSVPSTRDDAEKHVRELLDQWERDETVPFVQFSLADERIVGSTRYLTIRSRRPGDTPFAVEIGGTWLAASAQRTAVNTEAKRLLFEYAFSTWGVARVDLKTDARNERSRRAIARLGATFEGVLRSWQPSLVPGEESLYRDSAMFSVTSFEWPSVRANLDSLLSRGDQRPS